MKRLGFFFLVFMSLSTYVMAMIADTNAIPRDNIIRLVFMGKTGAGKSTSINACYNFTKQKKWNDFPKLFPIPTEFQPCNVPHYQGRLVENHARGQLNAVTQDPSEYVASGNGYVVHLIDCPGMADPRGMEQDIENTNKIAKFLARVGDFNAIVIVLQSTTNRETTEEQYFIEQVKTIIPSSAYNRIFIVATYSNLPSENIINFAKSVGLPVENIFYFDNFALTKEGHCDLNGICIGTIDDDDVGDPFAGGDVGHNQDEQKREIARRVNDTYPKSHKEFNRLIRTARSLGKHHTGEMAEICQLKQSATDKILEAYRKVESIEECATNLDAARHALQMAEEAYDRALENKNGVEGELLLAKAEKEAADALKTYEYYDEKSPVDSKGGPHTTCSECNVTCHEDCTITFQTGCSHLTECTCITDGVCTVCPGKCPYSVHKHEYFVWKTETKRRDFDDNKHRQSSASANHDRLSNQLSAKTSDVSSKNQTKNSKSELFAEFNRRLEQLKQEKDCLQQAIVELYVQLSHVSISSINFHIGEYYDFKIRKEQDFVKRLKLNRDRQFYEEQVELYRERQRNNTNI